MKEDGRGGMSPGSRLMMLLTALVIVSCAVFLMRIAGTAPDQSIDMRIRSLTEEGIFERAPDEAKAPSPTSSPGQARTQEAAVRVKQPEEAPKQMAFTLAAAGTLYAPKAIRVSAQDAAGNYDFSPIFEGLGDALGDADLSVVTLETAAAGEESGYGNYNTPPQILDALRACGVDLVSLATEHALDRGYDGLELTLRELTSRGMNDAGISGGATMIRIDGIQVAVLASTYGISEEGQERTDGDARGLLAMTDAQRMAQDISSARLAGANLVIVMPHWGTKNKKETPEDLRALARSFAEAGADVILGTHPNVVQETERLTVTRADGLEYEAVICYSLGSLLTDARAPENTAGMIARLTVEYDPETRRIALGALECLPIYIACEREEGQNVYRVVDVENAAAMQTLTDAERQAALEAARAVRETTGSYAGEGET